MSAMFDYRRFIPWLRLTRSISEASALCSARVLVRQVELPSQSRLIVLILATRRKFVLLCTAAQFSDAPTNMSNTAKNKQDACFREIALAWCTYACKKRAQMIRRFVLVPLAGRVRQKSVSTAKSFINGGKKSRAMFHCRGWTKKDRRARPSRCTSSPTDAPAHHMWQPVQHLLHISRTGQDVYIT